ncbi:hypothetical protein DFJ73DRAFT_761578 [Zopfochytrium polystomum]|nr:hypothetical protein DFJ73DRAFT_761578 [Zopfochytrium polystomum]
MLTHARLLLLFACMVHCIQLVHAAGSVPLFMMFYVRYLCQSTSDGLKLDFGSFKTPGAKSGDCLGGATFGQFYQFAHYCAGGTYDSGAGTYAPAIAPASYVQSTFDSFISTVRSLPSNNSSLAQPGLVENLVKANALLAQLPTYAQLQSLDSLSYVPSADKAVIESGTYQNEAASGDALQSKVLFWSTKGIKYTLAATVFIANSRVKLTNLVGIIHGPEGARITDMVDAFSKTVSGAIFGPDFLDDLTIRPGDIMYLEDRTVDEWHTLTRAGTTIERTQNGASLSEFVNPGC